MGSHPNKVQELKSAISRELLEKFQVRIAESRDTRVIHLLEYLTNPDFIFKGVYQFCTLINKSEITEYSITKIRWLDVCIDTNDEELETESEDDDNKRLNLAQELEVYIKKKTNVQSSGAVGVSLDLYVKLEMALYESRKNFRPELLEKLYQTLLTLRTTSVELEIAFNSMNLFHKNQE